MRLALKRLTPSDLTLFEWQFRNRNAGNQKAINLNADVLVSVLYPAVPEIAPLTNNEMPISLSLYGPGVKPEHRLTRKIIRGSSYKNWRLNGKFIRNPDNDSDRFNVLEPNDLAVMEFKGDLKPEAVSIFLLSKKSADDAQLHGALYSLLGNRSMIPLDTGALKQIVSKSNVEEDHPIHGLIVEREFEAVMEDAALGGEKSIRALVRRRPALRLSSVDLARAKAKADQVGRNGEGLVQIFLGQRQDRGELQSFVWSSDTNAVSPHDFATLTPTGEQIFIDVKATEGPFERTIHISAAELAEAAEAKERYDLIRVYQLDENGGKLRVSEGVREFARRVRKVGQKLPKGVTIDSFSAEPATLIWGPELEIRWPEELEEIDSVD